MSKGEGLFFFLDLFSTFRSWCLWLYFASIGLGALFIGEISFLFHFDSRRHVFDVDLSLELLLILVGRHVLDVFRLRLHLVRILVAVFKFGVIHGGWRVEF